MYGKICKVFFSHRFVEIFKKFSFVFKFSVQTIDLSVQTNDFCVSLWKHNAFRGCKIDMATIRQCQIKGGQLKNIWVQKGQDNCQVKPRSTIALATALC